MTTMETIQALPPGEPLTTMELAECCGVTPTAAYKAVQAARAFGLIKPSHVIVTPGKPGPGTTIWRRL